MRSENLDRRDIISGTKTKSVEKGCNAIGKKKWKRNCPKCNSEVFHVNKYTRDYYIKHGRTCRSSAVSVNIAGKTFGYLTAIKRMTETRYDGRSAVWLFRCVCGKEVIKAVHNVKRGRGDNCGCKWGEKMRRTKGVREYEWLFTKFKNQNKKRGIDVNISFAMFLTFTKITQCHYCHAPIYWAKHSPDCGKEPENQGYHLDRKNTVLPYDKENCVVCCNRCNYGKSNAFSYDEWYGMTQYFRGKV